jgi:hypothetical protein
MGCVQAWSAHGDLYWKKFSILLWQARVGRKIEIYVRLREEEM